MQCMLCVVGLWVLFPCKTQLKYALNLSHMKNVFHFLSLVAYKLWLVYHSAFWKNKKKIKEFHSTKNMARLHRPPPILCQLFVFNKICFSFVFNFGESMECFWSKKMTYFHFNIAWGWPHFITLACHWFVYQLKSQSFKFFLFYLLFFVQIAYWLHKKDPRSTKLNLMMCFTFFYVLANDLLGLLVNLFRCDVMFAIVIVYIWLCMVCSMDMRYANGFCNIRFEREREKRVSKPAIILFHDPPDDEWQHI